MREQDSQRIIIVGGGITGIVAALELLRAGRRVLLLDRDLPERLGGQARESFGGILAVDTPLQRRHGVRDSAARALEDWCRFGGVTPEDGWPYLWAHAYVQDCRGDVYEWLQGLGVRFLPVPQWPERAGNSVPRWHVVWGTGQRLIECLLAALARARQAHPDRLEMRFGHRVERLRLEGGRVTGVAGTEESGSRWFEFGGAAVLVASGGIGGDPARVRQYWPAGEGPAPRELLIGAHRYADGRLHWECQGAGAQLANLQRMWNYAAGVAHWNPRQPSHGLSLVPSRSALWLAPDGRRFDPPLLAGWDTSALVARVARAGGYSWQVLNRRIALRELAVSGAEFNPSIRDRRPLAFLRETLLGNRWLVDTLVDHCPDVVAAGSLEELVARMNSLLAPGDPLLGVADIAAEAARFDAARRRSASAADPQWTSIELARRWRGDRPRTARPGDLLDPADRPLIAIRARIISRKSLGGIVTDLDGRALDAAQRPVPGLFAAGEAAGFGGGGMNGRRALEGTFLGGCVYSARRAAGGIVRQAAQQKE